MDAHAAAATTGRCARAARARIQRRRGRAKTVLSVGYQRRAWSPQSERAVGTSRRRGRGVAIRRSAVAAPPAPPLGTCCVGASPPHPWREAAVRQCVSRMHGQCRGSTFTRSESDHRGTPDRAAAPRASQAIDLQWTEGHPSTAGWPPPRPRARNRRRGRSVAKRAQDASHRSMRSATFAGVNPNSSITAFSGALAPNRSIPMTSPSRPVYLHQSTPRAASIAAMR